MANISSSVELIISNSKKMRIASSTRELTTGSTAHLAISRRDARHRQQCLSCCGGGGYYQQGRIFGPYDNEDGYYNDHEDGYYDEEEDDFYHGDRNSDYYRR
ncbi:hypothetical protein D6C97_09317 [Aureobasidium pullulans]|nr:hypothetical protein D6C97_09317 [Aureobasidium pullulans]